MYIAPAHSYGSSVHFGTKRHWREENPKLDEAALAAVIRDAMQPSKGTLPIVVTSQTPLGDDVLTRYGLSPTPDKPLHYQANLRIPIIQALQGVQAVTGVRLNQVA